MALRNVWNHPHKSRLCEAEQHGFHLDVVIGASRVGRPRTNCTVNDLTFFKHYREVEHRDGSRETKWAAMQKTIYSLPALRELLAAANRRYLEFLSAIEDPRNGRNKLDKRIRLSNALYRGAEFGGGLE